MFQYTVNHYQGTSIKLECIKFKLLCANLSVLAAMDNVYQTSISLYVHNYSAKKRVYFFLLDSFTVYVR